MYHTHGNKGSGEFLKTAIERYGEDRITLLGGNLVIISPLTHGYREIEGMIFCFQGHRISRQDPRVLISAYDYHQMEWEVDKINCPKVIMAVEFEKQGCLYEMDDMGSLEFRPILVHDKIFMAVPVGMVGKTYYEIEG